jgi:hypothetical protein
MDTPFIPESPDFNFFITTLSIQTAICLGIMENPVNNKNAVNLPQAKFIIDTLDMLKTKTTGNLTKEESDKLDNLLGELKTQYVSKTAKCSPPG